MKSLFLTLAIVLPAFVFAYWPSEAAVLPTLSGETAIKLLNRNGESGSLMGALTAAGGGENGRINDEITQAATVETAKLTASDGGSRDNFGIRVAVSGDTAVVGAHRADVGLNADQGSAYVFTRSGSAWNLQAKLTALDGAANDFFGRGVSISGDTIVIGATRTNGGQGSMYVFARVGTVWTQQAKLSASAPTADMGFSVAVSGDTAIGSGFASAYIFARVGTSWVQQARLTASGSGATQLFGATVAVSGDTVVVGDSRHDVGSNTAQGSAYVFTRVGSAWTQQAQLTASDGAPSDVFGVSVAVSGDTAVIGAEFDDVGQNSDQGSAYVFARSGTVWTQRAKLTAADGATNDFLGRSVSVSGDTAVVGAHGQDVGPNPSQGSAYVFTRAGTVWTEQAQLTASDGAPSDSLGFDVAVAGNTAVVGAYFDDIGSNPDQGSAYVFQVATGTPTPTATPTLTPTPTPIPTPTPVPTRNLRIETSYVAAPGSVSMPITLITSAGNEQTVSFSLSYETSRLGSPSAQCGPDAPGCTIMSNASAQGLIGVTITFATPPVPGERRVATLTFASTAAGASSNTPVLFTDMPTSRVTRDAAGNPLPTGYTGGFVVFTEIGLEGDLATRFTGDGVYRATDVELMRAFVSGTEQPNAVTNEFERADVAPYGTKGDGRLLADDFQLVKNYVANLVGQQTAGGPDAAIPAAPFEGRSVRTGSGSDWVLAASRLNDEETARTLRIIENPNNEYSSPLGLEEAPREGRKVSITVEMDSLGDETVALFTLGFDPSILNNPVVNRADGTSEGATLTANTSKVAEGELTVLLDSATPFTPGYSKRLVTVTFNLAKNAAYAETTVTFQDMPSLAGADARPLRVGSSRLACLFLNQ